jgi:hypothetical protein
MQAFTDESGTPCGRATVRTYRHGGGDSHLVTLARADGGAYRILIAGSVAPPAAGDDIMADLIAHSGGQVDLLVATQETADLVPGFFQSAEALAKLDVGEVWLAWTEDPADAEARALHEARARALDRLRLAGAEVQLRGNQAESHAIAALLACYGVAGRASSGDPLAALRAKTAALHYCRPGEVRELPAAGARIHLFGPASGAKLALDEFVDNVMPNPDWDAADNPFNTLYSIPEPVARSMPFFQEHYWEDAPWRRIDTTWIADATQYALVLENLTHGAGLGLALELDGGEVLLFAPDGRPGAGLDSAQGRDLLARTVFYKAGPHAIAGQGGLGPMPSLRAAVIPVDQGDGEVHADALHSALAEAVSDRGYVLRTDQAPPPVALQRGVTATAAYFNVQL